MEQEVKVSAICLTYNQKKYIRQCLDSMLSQKTTFRYEIIVHDDASTDGTSEIVMEYEKKYPNMIRPIYQMENQYSLGKWTVGFALEKARGVYLAFCEGDDYWFGETKLQQQFDYMESHPGCSLCFHNTYTLDIDTGLLNKGWFFWKDKVFGGSGIYPAEKLIELEVTPCSSNFYRKKDVDFNCQNIIWGDMLITLCLAYKGYGYCLPNFLSVYRKGVENSAYTRSNSGIDEYNETIQHCIKVWNTFDQYTKNVYGKLVNAKIRQQYGRKLYLCFDSIEQVTRGTNQIYIYGTGVYAAICLSEMKKKELEIIGFVVSDGYEKPDYFKGYRVCFLSELPFDCGIIVAVGKEVRKRMVLNLEKSSITNYCVGLTEIIEGV